jgi:hypothetical protein
MRPHLPTRRLAVAIVATFQPLAVGVLSAATPASDKPAHSVEAEKPHVPAGFDRRQQAIDERLAAGNLPAWAGRYYEGEGLGVYIDLWIAPDVGATMTWRGHFGLLNADHGTVVESANGSIRIHYAKQNEATRYFRFPDELVPIAWADRQYLIPPDRIAEFASAINHRDEPRPTMGGRFLLRQGDNDKPVTGLPALPPSVQAHVRREAIEVRVASAKLIWFSYAEGGCAERYRLRIEPVTAATPPLFVGEQLTKPGVPFSVADVTAWHGESADAEFLREACTMVEAPKIGDRFTTGAYDAAGPAGR